MWQRTLWLNIFYEDTALRRASFLEMESNNAWWEGLNIFCGEDGGGPLMGETCAQRIVQPQVAEPRPTSNRITSYTTTFD